MSSMFQVQREPEKKAAEVPKQESASRLELNKPQHQSGGQTAAAALEQLLTHALQDAGYLPPAPPPFAMMRTLRQIKNTACEPDLLAALDHHLTILEQGYSGATAFAEATRQELASFGSLIDRGRMFLGRIDRAIDHAVLSFEAPVTEPVLQERMKQYERFAAETWIDSSRRVALSIHIDEAGQNTIFQICSAEHGALYVTVPRILRPEEIAHSSIRALLERLTTLHANADPLAVIDGSYQTFNFNYSFAQSRVIRVPSGETERLKQNLEHVMKRARLDPHNTSIVSSAPRNLDEYRAIFPRDTTAAGWSAWHEEAERWTDTTAGHGFPPAAESSQQSLMKALTTKENVIVLVAHCDRNEIFMPHPPPQGTQVTAEYLREHREAIAANKPFVYLFACEAARIDNLRNFASTLLDCGAAGVVASQSVLGAAESRDFLNHLLREGRQPPPVQDVWAAMRETHFLEMEVILG